MLAAPVTSQRGSSSGAVTVSALRKSPGESVSAAERGKRAEVERSERARVFFISSNGVRFFGRRTLNKEIFVINGILRTCWGDREQLSPRECSENFFRSSFLPSLPCWW